jgi:trigger factor
MQSGLQDAIQQQELRVAGVIQPAAPATKADGQFHLHWPKSKSFPSCRRSRSSALKIERPVADIEETDVDDMIQTLREQRREWASADRAVAESGDRVKALNSIAEVDGERIPEDRSPRQVQPVIGGWGPVRRLRRGADRRVGRRAEDRRTDLSRSPSATNRWRARRPKVEFRGAGRRDVRRCPRSTMSSPRSFGVEGGMEQMRADVRRNLERELRSGSSPTA